MRRWPALKRAIDLGLGIPALILASPLIALAGLAIATTMGRPVFFRQRRPGRNGLPFELIKLRTMREPGRHEDRFGSDEGRMTRLGRFLRRTSLDELPELWNVVRGEMSLVGPRPLLLRYLPRYTSEQARRHEVRPGITGWAQVNGRQDIPFSRRLELDVWYVDHGSLVLDLKILAMTVTQALCSQGVQLGQRVEEVDDIGLYIEDPAPKGLS